MARPELLDRRPAGPAGKVNATSVLLGAARRGLSCGRLIDEHRAARPTAASRIRDAAEGNPLFVEEMVAMVHGVARTAR